MSEGSSNSETGSQTGRLEKAFRSSMSWNLADRIISQVVTMVTFMFLTYKLSPTTFGLFALGVIAVDYFYLQGRTSAVDAIIQGRRYGRKAMNTAFWISSLVIALVTLTLFLSGGLLAEAMNEPALKYILPALALTLIPVPFAIPPTAMLLRDHDFSGIAIRGIIAALAGGIVAVATALSSYPEWALVTQRATLALISTTFLLFRAKWFPGLSLAKDYAARFSRDAVRIFAAQAVGASFMRILELIVAIFHGMALLGLMRAASGITNAIYGAFAAPIGSLWVILLSEGEKEHQDRTALFLRLTQMSSLICLPVFAGIALTAHDTVELVMADEFRDAGSVLAIMCIAGLLVPLGYFRNHALTALRRLNLLLSFSIIDVIVISIAALILAPISMEATVASLVVMYAVRTAMALPVLLKEMDTRFSALFQSMIPAYLGCIVMAGAVFAVTPLVADMGPLLRLAIKAGIGAGTYTVYILLVHREWLHVALSMIFARKATPRMAQEAPFGEQK